MSQAEFVTEAFNVTVGDKEIQNTYQKVGNVVKQLRGRFESDSRLEEIFRDRNNSEYLKRSDSIEREKPERLTEDVIIEPIFEVLGIPPSELRLRAGDFADDRGQETDYVVRVGSERVVIEAEPLNKNLDWKNVGIDQVKSWLETRQFQSDYGIATNGIRWVLLRYDSEKYDYDIVADIDLRPVFIRQFESVTGKSQTLNRYSKNLSIDERDKNIIKTLRERLEIENLRNIVTEASEILRVNQQKITEEFYDDYIQLVFGVVDESSGERTERCLVEAGVKTPESVVSDSKNIRLFSVSLINRLIFIKFLEDKGIVEPNLLKKLAEEHKDGRHPDSFYNTFIEPLFSNVFDTRPSRRHNRVQEVDAFSSIPYLNGGLFQSTLPHEEHYDVADSILIDIINLLENYTFSTDGGFETLDPSILGNVFEKTINYIAVEEGQQKKELGAFYTPDAITQFTAKKTVRPVILRRMKDVLRNRGWAEPEIAQFETIDDIINDIPPSESLIDEFRAEIDTIRIADPACGSGHFLTSVLGEVANVRKALHRKVSSKFSELEVKKRTVMNNIYGVDIVSPAVEIAKLRLWLSIIADLKPDELTQFDKEELALPNITFNIRQGNSLIGFTTTEVRDGNQSTLTETEFLNLIPKYKSQIREARTEHDNFNSLLSEIDDYRVNINQTLDDSFLQTMSDFVYEDTFDFDRGSHDVQQELKARSDGCRVSKVGFYVNKSLKQTPENYRNQLSNHGITTFKWKANMSLSTGLNDSVLNRFSTALNDHPNPSSITEIFIERGLHRRDIESLDRFHWFAEFPEAISLTSDKVELASNGTDSDFGFDVIIGNPPFGADIDGLYKKITEQEEFFNCHGANNSAEYFTERAIQLCKSDGRIGFVLPKSMSYYDSWSEIRNKIFNDTNITALFDNGLAFHDVDYEVMTLIAARRTSNGE